MCIRGPPQATHAYDMPYYCILYYDIPHGDLTYYDITYHGIPYHDIPYGPLRPRRHGDHAVFLIFHNQALDPLQNHLHLAVQGSLAVGGRNPA